MSDESIKAGKPGLLGTLGWAAYLACSWTWCIGMFLPVLLVRDFGIWGFVVFAVPNVIGAGAMGWVLKNGASERIRQSHRIACAVFSIVTVVFQTYFAGWFLFRIQRPSGYSVQYPIVVALTLATIAAIGAFSILIRRNWRGWQLIASGAVLLLSIIMLGLMLRRGLMEEWSPRYIAQVGKLESGVPWMLAVCIFGFGLCPYLDLTFLKAHSRLPRAPARAAFSLGFGVFFTSMILGTLAYAPLANGIIGYPVFKAGATALVIPLAVHMFAQLGTTIAFHVEELTSQPRELRPKLLALLLVGITIAAMLCAQIDWQVISRVDMLVGEVVYRLFMSFYGLVFPAYVWLCMIPARGEAHTHRPTRRKLLALAAACVCAAPFYWMGFIERETIWLVPGLGIVLVARLFIRGLPSVSATGTEAKAVGVAP